MGLTAQEKLQKSNEEREAKKEALIIDFDEAVREEKSKAIIVKFDGKEYPLPQNAPAWLPLFINRHTDKNGIVSDKHNLELIERLLGKEFSARIIDESDNFVSFEIVNNVILKPVMEQWGMGLSDESAPNEKTPGS